MALGLHPRSLYAIVPHKHRVPRSHHIRSCSMEGEEEEEEDRTTPSSCSRCSAQPMCRIRGR